MKVDDLISWCATGEADEGMVTAANITVEDWNFVAGEGAELFGRLSQMSIKLKDVAIRMYQGSITSADTLPI